MSALIAGLVDGACSTSELDTDEAVDTRPTATSSPSVAPVVEPSGQCRRALQAASEVPIDESVSDAIHESVNACGSVDEWLSALRLFPGAMGLSGPEFVGQIDIEVACTADRNHDSPVCLDAAEMGIPLP